MTDREKAIVMAYTGVCMLSGDKFQIFHKYVEDIMQRPIMTHELSQFENEIKEKSKADFIALCADHVNERDKVCIKAARFAVGEMTLKGSFGYITSSHNKMQHISWIEVINWLDDMLEKI